MLDKPFRFDLSHLFRKTSYKSLKINHYDKVFLVKSDLHDTTVQQ